VSSTSRCREGPPNPRISSRAHLRIRPRRNWTVVDVQGGAGRKSRRRTPKRARHTRSDAMVAAKGGPPGIAVRVRGRRAVLHHRGRRRHRYEGAESQFRRTGALDQSGPSVQRRRGALSLVGDGSLTSPNNDRARHIPDSLPAWAEITLAQLLQKQPVGSGIQPSSGVPGPAVGRVALVELRRRSSSYVAEDPLGNSTHGLEDSITTRTPTTSSSV